MRFDAPPPTMRVVKKELKQEQLTSFIATHLDERAAEAAEDAEHALRHAPCHLLLVRSPNSPVVHALAAHAKRLAAAGVSLKVVIALPEPDAAALSWPTELCGSLEARRLSDLRLLDAHEQLWLDPDTAWIGDCMRRDPSQRDAYECYAADSAVTARCVMATFKWMWQKATPIAAPGLAKPLPAEATQDEIEAHLPAAGTSTAAPHGATRH